MQHGLGFLWGNAVYTCGINNHWTFLPILLPESGKGKASLFSPSPANEKTVGQPLMTANGNAKQNSHCLSEEVFCDFVHQQSARYSDTGQSLKGISLPIPLFFNAEHLCLLSRKQLLLLFLSLKVH